MHRISGALGVLLAVAIAGCGAAADRPAPSAGDVRPAGENVSLAAHVEAQARTLAARTSPYQARILRDGRVTFDEYAAATTAERDCFVRVGGPVEVGAVRRTPGGELHFRWTIETRSKRALRRAEQRGRARGEACRARFRSDVALIYANQRVVPDARRPAVRDELVACLRRAGLAVPSAPSMEQLLDILDSDTREGGTRCAERHADFFRILAPLPGAS